ncbi:hypothetical protein Pla163_34890 [Planctomycetes bacterium Pla163]|uniref:Uncharacterized protein n=1 Tax=Rohdeia mirabilis TaxID=2528008 RepID=A0A518D4D7_9BACT|nr:hypothetical protein Pla163_34890 [Planctomycetes bacterium Pla163]
MDVSKNERGRAGQSSGGWCGEGSGAGRLAAWLFAPLLAFGLAACTGEPATEPVAHVVEVPGGVVEVPGDEVEVPSTEAPTTVAPFAGQAAAEDAAEHGAEPSTGDLDRSIVEAPIVEAPPTPAVEPDPAVRYERLATVGASASGGFGLRSEVGRDVALADLIRAAAPDSFGEVRDLADAMFFLMPDQNLDEALAELRDYEPDVIVGADLLFWFGYGGKSMELRLPHVRQALARLDTLLEESDAILLLGDFPDVRDATPLMMPKRYEPDDETLAALNAEVRGWIEARPRAHLVPLAAFLDDLKAGRSIELRGETVDTSDATVWLQGDRLHPTLAGTAALALMTLQTLERTAPLEGTVRWDPIAVADRVRRKPERASDE